MPTFVPLPPSTPAPSMPGTQQASPGTSSSWGVVTGAPTPLSVSTSPRDAASTPTREAAKVQLQRIIDQAASSPVVAAALEKSAPASSAPGARPTKEVEPQREWYQPAPVTTSAQAAAILAAVPVAVSVPQPVDPLSNLRTSSPNVTPTPTPDKARDWARDQVDRINGGSSGGGGGAGGGGGGAEEVGPSTEEQPPLSTEGGVPIVTNPAVTAKPVETPKLSWAALAGGVGFMVKGPLGAAVGAGIGLWASKRAAATQKAPVLLSARPVPASGALGAFYDATPPDRCGGWCPCAKCSGYGGFAEEVPASLLAGLKAIASLKATWLSGKAKLELSLATVGDEAVRNAIRANYATLGAQIDRWAGVYSAWASAGHRDDGSKYTWEMWKAHAVDLGNAVKAQTGYAWDASTLLGIKDTIAETAHQIETPTEWPWWLKAGAGLAAVVAGAYVYNSVRGR